MKRITLLIAVIAMIPATALATTDEYYTVAWEKPYPQTLHTWTSTGAKPNLDALDDQLTGCADYQIDVYRINSDRDRQKLEGLLTSGVLNKGDDYSIYYASKHVEVHECATTTTIGTTTTTEQSTTTSTLPTSTTTTLEPSTTTSQPASSTTDPAPPVLPFTGMKESMALAGAALLALGSLTIYLVRDE